MDGELGGLGGLGTPRGDVKPDHHDRYRVADDAVLGLPIAGEAARQGATALTTQSARNAAEMARNGAPVVRTITPQTEGLLRRLAASVTPFVSGDWLTRE